MSANIRVGGARVDFSANAGGYLSTLRRIEAANRGLLTSYSGIGRQAQRQTQFIDQFTASMRSSLIATAAYAVGVNAVRLALGGSIGGFRDLDAGLIRIAKTTNLADDQLGRLRVSLTAINTESSRLGPPLNIAREQLLRIGEVVGQLGVRGVPAITQFTRAAAALDISSDLFGEDAARALGRFIASTGTAQNEVDGVASAVTALGNVVAGGERDILQYSTRLARDVAGSGRLANDTLIALAASFVNVGAAPEAAATAIGRTLDTINQLAGDENLQRFRILGEVAGVTREEVDRITSSFRDGVPSAEDYGASLNIVARALTNLPRAGGPGELTRGGLLELIFGNTNVRIRSNLGVLSAGIENFAGFQEEANQALTDGDRHYQEAARAAGGFGARLSVVGEQIKNQSTSVGELLAPAVLFAAENFRVFEVAALTAGAALTASFGARAITRIRTAQRQYGAQLETTANLSRRFAVNEQANLAAATAAQQAQTRARAADAVSQQQIDAIRQRSLFLQREQVRISQITATVLQARGAQSRAYGVALYSEERAIRRANAAQLERTAILSRAGTGFRRLAVVEQEIIARTRATAATRAHGAAVSNLSRRTRILNRVTRAGAATLAFLGGPLGALLTGLTLVSAGFLLFETNAGKAARQSRKLREDLESLAMDLRNTAAGQTAEGGILAATAAEIERLEARAEGLRQVIERFIVPNDQPRQLRRQVGPIVAEIKELQALRDEINERLREAADPEAVRPGRRVLPQFERVDLSLQVATRSVRDFYQALVDGSEAAIRAAQNEAAVAGDSPLFRAFERLRFSEVEALDAQRTVVQRGLEDALRDLARAQQLVPGRASRGPAPAHGYGAVP